MLGAHLYQMSKKPHSAKKILKGFYAENSLEVGIDEVGRGPLFGRVYVGAGQDASLYYDGSNMNVVSTGNVDFTDESIRTTGSITIAADSTKLYLGGDQDSSVYFDGTDLIVSSNDAATTAAMKVVQGQDMTAVKVDSGTTTGNILFFEFIYS